MTRTAQSVPGGHADLVRSFDHEDLATLPGYPELRQALHTIAGHANEPRLTHLVEAVRDMAATAVYGDWCPTCGKPAWPYRVVRSRSVVATYRCPLLCEKTWTRAYAIAAPSLVIRSPRQRPGPDDHDRPTTTTTARDQE